MGRRWCCADALQPCVQRACQGAPPKQTSPEARQSCLFSCPPSCPKSSSSSLNAHVQEKSSYPRTDLHHVIAMPQLGQCSTNSSRFYVKKCYRTMPVPIHASSLQCSKEMTQELLRCTFEPRSARQTSSPVLAACNARPSLGIACFDRVSPPVPVLPDHIVWRPISKTSFAGGIGLCGTIFIDKSCKPFNCASIRSRALLSPIPLLYLPLDWPSIC